ncbi:Gfo/Idh/MocA family protein [Litorimonas haliclonae]|uniref:Gfo/Idh/MocA family protein n=1 Tax=Litorimonas haliclonae TaxID=2081977 RepID=UPI0039F0DF77
MEPKKLKIGLIGAGVFGGYHANKLAAHEQVDFLGLFDPDVERSSALAEKHGVKSYKGPSDLFSAVDAVVIACPAIYHGENAIAALQANCHALIEKPIATSLEEAEKIVSLAEEKNLIVQIGHQERFVAAAIGLDKTGETPTHIIAVRNTGYSPRGTDTSVTLDLMTHDIDLCCLLMGEAPISVSGASEPVKSKTPDTARAELNFANGTAILSASRVEEGVSRQMTLKYPSGTVLIDFAAKTLQHNTSFALNADFGAVPSAADSLGAATNSFIAAILDGAPVSASAQDGLTAARVALQIDG